MHLTPGASGCDGELSPQPGGEVTEARGSEVAGRSPRGLEWRPVRSVLIADPGALAKDVCAPSSGLHVLSGRRGPLSHGGRLSSGALQGGRTALARAAALLPVSVPAAAAECRRLGLPSNGP